jgi:TonB family protein
MKNFRIRLAIAVFFAVCSFSSFAQSDDTAKKTTGDQMNKPKRKLGFPVEQKKAEFPGGEGRMMAWLDENLRYPPNASMAREKGKTVLMFDVSKEGKLSNIQVISSTTDEFKEEGLRIGSILPDFKPATAGGTAVESQYLLTIDFGGASDIK